MNAVLLGILIMLVLSVLRVNVVLSLVIGAFASGLMAGLPLADVGETKGIVTYFQNGFGEGAKIALSYAMLGAFAMAITQSGLPQRATSFIIQKIDRNPHSPKMKIALFGGLISMSMMSQNLIPIHIAFIPMLIPPLLLVFNRLQIDRRLLACIMTFGLVATYMFFPYGFGAIFLNKILLSNIQTSGMDTKGINVMAAMGIPALGMVIGLISSFFHYGKNRIYENKAIDQAEHHAALVETAQFTPYRGLVAAIAILICFILQVVYGELLIGASAGFAIFMIMRAMPHKNSDDVFNQGIKMMANIGFIMIAAQGFAAVMQASGAIPQLVQSSMDIFGGNKGMAAFAMLFIGLLVTMGIGSSFSTLPIITAVYVPLCISLGFSPLATVSIIGTAGALGDAGSPASDSTLGPTMGLNADGQHNHMYDTVIPTFIHYNIPLFILGWIAAMVL